ncbi:MAG: glycosyltransferase family 4 protein [Chloroflexi bacterium]|nr:glycosyltransferase family 4 protein [Chloroflexota bacterium]
MRIAYLSRGNTSVDRRFLKKMVDRGHEPTLISYSREDVVEVPGVQVCHYPGLIPARIGRLVFLQRAWHLRRLLARLKPDILHTFWMPDHGFYGAVSGFHPTVAMTAGSDVLLRPQEGRVLRWEIEFALKRADRVACDCEYVKRKILELTGRRSDAIVVFTHGVDLSVFRPSPPPSSLRRRLGWEGNTVLIMCRGLNKPIYGLEYFVEVLPVVVRARPDTRVIFLGAGPIEPVCRARVAELGLSEKVHFAGQVDEMEVAEHLNAADIYVSSSLSDGSSVAMLEAMACGLPVVVSDVPSYLEWVEDGVNGFIVPRRDTATLASRLSELVGHPEAQRAMGQRNLHIAQVRADWESSFSVLEDVYRGLVNHR